MKTQVDLSFLGGHRKYYCFDGLKEGVNECFFYIKVFEKGGKSSYKTRKVFVYVHEGVVIKNATSAHTVLDCLLKFRSLFNANGDITKVGFEISHELETFKVQ